MAIRRLYDDKNIYTCIYAYSCFKRFAVLQASKPNASKRHFCTLRFPRDCVQNATHVTISKKYIYFLHAYLYCKARLFDSSPLCFLTAPPSHEFSSWFWPLWDCSPSRPSANWFSTTAWVRRASLESPADRLAREPLGPTWESWDGRWDSTASCCSAGQWVPVV